MQASKTISIKQEEVYPSAVIISGDAQFTAPGTKQYTAAFDTQDYDAQLVSVAWSLAGSSGSLTQTGDWAATVEVDAMPLIAETMVITVDALFSSGVHVRGTKDVLVDASTRPQSATIEGSDSIAAVGITPYEILFDTEEFTDPVSSIVFLLAPSVSGVSIQDVALCECNIRVESLPETDTNLVLSALITFESGQTLQATPKQVTIYAHQYTYPNSVIINGAAAFSAPGSQSYDWNFDTQDYDAEVLSVNWSVSGGGVTISSSDPDQAILALAMSPETVSQATLTCEVTMSRNHVVRGSKTITVSAATYPSLAIAGAASIDAAGSQAYTKQTSGSGTAVADTTQWSLTPSDNAVLRNTSDSGCEIYCPVMPETSETLTLTMSQTFTNGHSETITKQVVISAATYPSLSISGAASIDNPGYQVYTKQTSGSGTADADTTQWQISESQYAVLRNTSANSCEIAVAMMPTAAETLTLTMSQTFTNGHSETITKQVVISAATYPSLSIAGADEVKEAGTESYTGATSGTFNAVVQSKSWSLSASQNASIDSQSDNSCDIAVSTIPDPDETLTLTWSVLFTNGHTETATKQILLTQHTIPESFVDLGLPSGLLWDSKNIGANAPEDFGLFFQWGDIEGHAAGSGYSFSLANYNSKGLNNISADLALSQDAANHALGGACRMPGKLEFQELYNNTDTEWTTINGVSGRKFMKKSDHDVFIFFPATGFYDGITLQLRNQYGFSWSNSYKDSSYAYYLRFTNSQVEPQCTSDYRYSGFTVRAVCPSN